MRIEEVIKKLKQNATCGGVGTCSATPDRTPTPHRQQRTIKSETREKVILCCNALLGEGRTRARRFQVCTVLNSTEADNDDGVRRGFKETRTPAHTRIGRYTTCTRVPQFAKFARALLECKVFRVRACVHVITMANCNDRVVCCHVARTATARKATLRPT